MKLKSTFLKGFVALGLVVIGTTNAQALTLELTHNPDGWSWHEIYLDNGPRYIFTVEEKEYWNDETQNWEYEVADYAYLWRIEGNGHAYNVELPSYVTVSLFHDESKTVTVPVSYLGYPNGWLENYDCHNMSITVPDTYTQISGISSDSFAKVKLLSSNPPRLENCANNVTFIVPDNAYNTYMDYQKNGYDGWLYQHIRPTTITLITIDNTAGNLLNALESDRNTYGNLSNVFSLKIKGTINGRDMNVFSLLTNLENLDLSEATVVTDEREDQYLRGCNHLKYLESVVLPAYITTIESEAFYNCISLKSINLENITKMGNYAFQGCMSLTSVDISKLTEIPHCAFNDAYTLSSVKLADNVTLIDSYAFSYTSFTNFNLPVNARLGYGILRGTPIKELSYYKNTNIEGGTFNEMPNLEALYCYDPIPYRGNFELSNNNTILYVPAFALDTYLNNPNYFNVLRVQEMDKDLDNLSIYDGNLILETTKGLASIFNMEIGKDASFVNETGEALNINKFVQYARYGASTNYDQSESNNNLKSTYFISNNKAEAKSVELNLALMNSNYWSGSNAWNFISFPFNINIKDIVTPENALWTIREYNGAERAANPYDGNSKWINKTTGTLEAGKGYIIHFTVDYVDENKWGNGYDYGLNYFKFPAVQDSKMNNLFAYQDVKLPLNFYDSEFEHNKSWNLVGNPYDSYYDLNGIQYSNKSGVSRVPITVWRRVNGSYTYEAFSADDEFTLLPFEAFFVQAIDDKNLNMLFSADGRITSEISTRALTRAADPVEGTQRSIFNIYISNANSSDRTRLVINNDASVAYEISCDASKFLAPEAETAQIYMLENNEKLAINERPFGEGVYNMGVRIGNEGIYTITCDSRNGDNYEVILIDTFTGKETSLTKSSYSFNAQKGSDSRFLIKLIGSTNGGSNGETTGIDEVNNNEPIISIKGQTLSVSSQGAIEVYTIDGKIAASGVNSLNVTLPQGMYIIKTAEESLKAVIR